MINFFKKLFKKKPKKQQVETQTIKVVELYGVVLREDVEQLLESKNIVDVNDLTDEELFTFDRELMLLCKSMTVTDKQAIEYAYAYLYNKHKEHFKQWVELKYDLIVDDDFDFQSSKEFLAYLDSLYEHWYEEFLFIPITLPIDDIAAVYRALFNYEPLGCSYESPLESMDFHDDSYKSMDA